LAEILKIRVTGSPDMVNEFAEHVGEKDRTGKLEIREISSYKAFTSDLGTRVVEVELEKLDDLFTNSEE